MVLRFVCGNDAVMSELENVRESLVFGGCCLAVAHKWSYTSHVY